MDDGVASLIEHELGCAPLVLVVADHAETREGIEALLSRDGYLVETARDEDEGVDRAANCCPNLILITLGGSPDDAVAAAVRVRRRADIDASVPVVIFSIATIAEGAEICLGRNIHVTRPDNFDQLRTLLGRLVLESIRVF